MGKNLSLMESLEKKRITQGSLTPTPCRTGVMFNGPAWSEIWIFYFEWSRQMPDGAETHTWELSVGVPPGAFHESLHAWLHPFVSSEAFSPHVAVDSLFLTLKTSMQR